MNLVKLQALLTGSFINATQQPATTSVQGFYVPGQEAYDYGGGFSRRRKRKKKEENPLRLIHPGLNDGSRAPKRKKHETSYAEYDREGRKQFRDFNFRSRDLIEDPHIDNKRKLDSDVASARKRARVEPGLRLRGGEDELETARLAALGEAGLNIPEAVYEEPSVVYEEPSEEQLDQSRMDEEQHRALAAATPAALDQSRMDEEQHRALAAATPAAAAQRPEAVYEEPREDIAAVDLPALREAAMEETGVRQLPEEVMTGTEYRRFLDIETAAEQKPEKEPPIDWAFGEPQTAVGEISKAGLGEKRPAEEVEEVAADEPPAQIPVAGEEPPPQPATVFPALEGPVPKQPALDPAHAQHDPHEERFREMEEKFDPAPASGIMPLQPPVHSAVTYNVGYPEDETIDLTTWDEGDPDIAPESDEKQQEQGVSVGPSDPARPSTPTIPDAEQLGVRRPAEDVDLDLTELQALSARRQEHALPHTGPIPAPQLGPPGGTAPSAAMLQLQAQQDLAAAQARWARYNAPPLPPTHPTVAPGTGPIQQPYKIIKDDPTPKPKPTPPP